MSNQRSATSSNPGERDPLLPTTTANKSPHRPPFTSPTTTTGATADIIGHHQPQKKRKAAMGDHSNHPRRVPGAGGALQQHGGGGAAALVDVNRNMFQKQVRPQFRKKHLQRPSQATERTWVGRIGMHMHVDEIDIDVVAEHFAGLPNWNATAHYEVVRLWQTETPYIGHEFWSGDWPLSEEEGEGGGDTTGTAIDMTAAMPEIYLFRFGACVFWNFPNAKYEEDWIQKTLLENNDDDASEEMQDCCGDVYKEEEIDSAMDSIKFRYYGRANATSDTAAASLKFTIKQDVCILSTRDAGEKLAVSFAVAKSSLLSLYELRVQQVIERNSHLPEEMVKNGHVKMSTSDLTREIGRLFMVKHGINLDQSLIDTPEEFWEDDRFESTYDTTLKYFKITKRLDLVNNRLDMIGELHNKILEENHTRHGVILEWIVILLIVVEVLLDMLHLGFY